MSSKLVDRLLRELIDDVQALVEGADETTGACCNLLDSHESGRRIELRNILARLNRIEFALSLNKRPSIRQRFGRSVRVLADRFDPPSVDRPQE